MPLTDLEDWFPLWREALKGWNVRESPFVNEMKSEELRETLGRLLKKRFGAVPEAVQQRIDALTDLNALRDAIDRAIEVSRAEDLLP